MINFKKSRDNNDKKSCFKKRKRFLVIKFKNLKLAFFIIEFYAV